ncbi:MAG: hypothetical protein IJV69_02375 [Kiritimatiellae bacterium]|nr:hypothetical protein [Kiritimatiellia bacterium]
MDLIREEYERLIELQAAALWGAERDLATLREKNEELKKALDQERAECRSLRTQVVAQGVRLASEVMA